MKATAKKVLSLVLVAALTAALAIGGTLAYLTMDTDEEENVFLVGNINIELDEEVGLYGEGGEVKEKENGAEYSEIMPGDYLKKEVTITNTGKHDAYVAVTVTMNNGDKINSAIDTYYEAKFGKSAETDEYIFNKYNFIFDGWGMNYYHKNEYGTDARNTITKDDEYNTDWPEHALKVDYAERITDYWLYSKGNWFLGNAETDGKYWIDAYETNADGYYTSDLDKYTWCYTYYLYLPVGESSTLFNGLNVPADFTREQLAMFDGLKINVKASAIQADNMSIAEQYKGDKNGKAKTAFAILAGDIETPEYSAKPIGTVTKGYTAIVGKSSLEKIWGEATTNAKESVVVKIYSGDTYLGSTSLNDVNNIIDGNSKSVTWSIALNGTSTDNYWTMDWKQVPTLDTIPTTAELWVDGEKVDENVIKMSAPGGVNPVTGVIINNDGEIVKFVTKNYTASDGETYVPFVSSNADLAAALTSEKEQINVVLTGDVDLPISSLGQETPGSGEYKLGGENTENITIDLNGHKLNITTSYWSAIGAKNENATFTIKNGTMTSSQATGTWNSYDVSFANCNYKIENVTFEKAVAFTNAGKSVKMNNVIINETHDYYAIWISAEGQNVAIDGLTVNSEGRGIKIDEEYVSAPEKVTLNVSNATFNTKNKAAIMVKSPVGADIVLNNVNISGVKADTTNAVWVDSEAAGYADKVTVTGGSVITEQ